METRPYVSWELMNDFMVEAFKGYGVPEEELRNRKRNANYGGYGCT